MLPASTAQLTLEEVDEIGVKSGVTAFEWTLYWKVLLENLVFTAVLIFSVAFLPVDGIWCMLMDLERNQGHIYSSATG